MNRKRQSLVAALLAILLLPDFKRVRLRHSLESLNARVTLEIRSFSSTTEQRNVLEIAE